jgi:branched-chain amino acid transport system ATP-binding protein
MMLEVVGLTRRFGGLIAVNNVTLSVAQGEIRGLIGPNGAGKTTLFNLLTGVLRPTAGLVHYEGTNITGEPIHRLVRRGIVRTYQLSQLFAGFTVYRNVLSALHVHARSGFWAGLLELPAVHRQNAALAERALEIVRFVGLNGSHDGIGAAPT